MTPRRVPQSSDRALSPVVGVVLLVGITLLLAATVSVTALGFTDELTGTAPTVSQSSGTYDRYASGGGRYTEQVVRITHEGGDTLTVTDIAIVVDASDACGKTGRLVNLPAEGDDPRPASKYVRGDDIFDNSANSVEGPIGTDDGEWSAGETAQFRLAIRACRVDDGDRLVVRIVHTPTDAVVVDQPIRA
ncbi:type IV pilin [Haloarcula salinisoli]|uniref:Type IV pilin n=1 Tax=Haloarcula salinisoli TaxID=2487746 RepID=A0A8J7YFA1_9EURY|nr:type IV pilin [Halomicroarcula salinisoli]MBX0287417.1 type IV pilin [Halomicroarcula salinisoli]MBX0305010.1 type IV pilin [Halomicroarcula salinisoli]